ncbi:N-acetylmuramoyl-L-alanine amidase [Ktedonospora formicarum]|nr:peptidoglycan-binding protein [Ktedonospora formicarum]
MASSRQIQVPTILSCEEWGARLPQDALTVLDKKATKILVHNTAFPNTTDHSLAQAIQRVKDIQDLHMDTNGWSDTGQHFTVSQGGYILEGRHNSLSALQSGNKFVVSAHCPALNTEAIGIESDGSYIEVLPPEELWKSLVTLCVYICSQYGLNVNNIFGHWDFRATDCPGIKFYSKFPELRREVAKRLGAGQIPARTWPDLRLNVSGIGVEAIQYLMRDQGNTITVDGAFGPATNAQVKAFQTSKGIIADGFTRNDTWEALVKPLHKGSQGDQVSALQGFLVRNGFDLKQNGQFDDATMHAVKQVQTLHRLPPTGKVNLDTWCVVTGGNVRGGY